MTMTEDEQENRHQRDEPKSCDVSQRDCANHLRRKRQCANADRFFRLAAKTFALCKLNLQTRDVPQYKGGNEEDK